MGKTLEIIKKKIFFVLLLIISSCSSNKDFSRAKYIFENYLNPKNKDVEKEITSEMLKDINYPIIMVQTNKIVQRALMLPMTTRDGFQNFTSGSGKSLTTQGSLITKTNGFNAYLISAKVNETSPLTTNLEPENWPKEEYFEYSFISSDFKIKSYSVECKYLSSTDETIKILENNIKLKKIIQNCSYNKNNEYENIFWLRENGEILKSQQYLIENDMIFEITRLKD